MSDERLLAKIDEQERVQVAADQDTVDSLKSVGQLVFQVAAKEVTLELASQHSLEAAGPNLTDLAEDISDLRGQLFSIVESAIVERKRSLVADHHKNLLLEELTGDIA